MNSSLLATSDVWMEGEALAQLERAAALPGCVRAVGMPDLHPGPGGMPVGMVLAFEDAIYPGLIGSDAGCGVRVVCTRLRRPSLDRLERRLRAAMDAPLPWRDVPDVLERLRARGIAGLAEVDALPESLRRLAALEPAAAPLPESQLAAGLLGASHRNALGTIGGGNHFAEVACVSEVATADAGREGILHDRLVVLVHSGSRSIGRALAEQLGAVRLAGADRDAYLAAHAWACRFAHANRWLLVWRMLAAAEAVRPDKLTAVLDRVHNQVVRSEIEGRELWVHRKGAAPAQQGRTTVVLGSRGAPSYLMRGTGNAIGLESVAHGAGRKLTRADALTKMRFKHRRAALGRSKLGSRVLSNRAETLYEEHPDAYKPIRPVVDSIIAARLATPLATLTPLITVKQ